MHALVYEEARVGLTGRFVHDAPSVAISPALADGETTTVSLVSSALSGVDWSKIHVVVLADCRPGGASGQFDTLQAAVALDGLIFEDGFESGETSTWSSKVAGPP